MRRHAFLVMEFVEGESLDQRLMQLGSLPVAAACDFVRQAAIGLQFAHEKGMIHRDIKPHNLMRAADGTIKILDFGLARILREVDPSSVETTRKANGDQSGGQITAVGVVMGTVDYMAPEQARDSRTADIRADIYSLGCTLYHLLSGQVPFPDGTVADKIRKHAESAPEPLAVPSGLMPIINRMMAKKPHDRFPTPGEVAAALEPFARPKIVTPRRRLWVPCSRIDHCCFYRTDLDAISS